MHKEYFEIIVPHSHHETTADGHGTRLIQDPSTRERVLVEIDIKKIAEIYGRKACLAKTKRTRQLNGLIKISHIGRSEP